MNQYINYAKALKQIVKSKNNFKSAIFQHFKGNQLKSAYGILIKTSHYFPQFEQIAQELIKKKKADIQNVHLFAIYCTDLFLSDKKKIQGGGKLKKLITDNKEYIQKRLKIDENFKQTIEGDVNNPNSSQSYQVKKATYVRFIQGRTDLESFKSTFLQNEEESQQIQLDTDIKNLVKLPHQIYKNIVKSHAEEFFASDKFIIQSKSSSFPAYLLTNFFENKIICKNQTIKFDIIDSCSAPGNKTFQLAEYIKGRGKVFAFEKDEKRFQLLSKRIKQYKYEDVIEPMNQDFLETDVNSNKFKNVQLVLMDPSCSGSGMLNQIYFDKQKANSLKNKQKNQENNKNKNEDKIDEEEEEEKEEECITQKQFAKKCQEVYENLPDREKERIQQLKDFQIQIIKKGMSFPNVKAVSYSTCSLYEKENEEVTSHILNDFKDKNWKLEHLAPDWKTRGFRNQNFIEGDKCIRVNPFSNSETDGFFVTIFSNKFNNNSKNK